MKNINRRIKLTKNNVPQIAFIGCGAVVEKYHLPAIIKLGIKPIIFIDPNIERAKSMAKIFSGKVASDYREMFVDFDAAIVSVPHTLHSTICIDLLSQGKHVFVEKPMASTVAESKEMIETARNNNATLAVGLFRRFLNSSRWVKSFLDNEGLGEILNFDFQEGYIYAWPVTTDSFWKRDKAGGGVLMDTGAHTLDQLIWWLGDFKNVDYKDDSYGGVEANCFLNIELRFGAKGTVELSRSRNLCNRAIITGRKGTLEIKLMGNDIHSTPPGLIKMSYNGLKGTHFSRQSVDSLFINQMQNWLESIITGNKPYVDGIAAAKSIDLITTCYEHRKHWKLPWI